MHGCDASIDMFELLRQSGEIGRRAKDAESGQGGVDRNGSRVKKSLGEQLDPFGESPHVTAVLTNPDKRIAETWNISHIELSAGRLDVIETHPPPILLDARYLPGMVRQRHGQQRTAAGGTAHAYIRFELRDLVNWVIVARQVNIICEFRHQLHHRMKGEAVADVVLQSGAAEKRGCLHRTAGDHDAIGEYLHPPW